MSKQISDKADGVEICLCVWRNGNIVQLKPAIPEATSAATKRACDAVKSRGAQLESFRGAEFSLFLGQYGYMFILGKRQHVNVNLKRSLK